MRLSIAFIVVVAACTIAQPVGEPAPIPVISAPVMLQIAEITPSNVKAYIAKIQELKESGNTNLWLRIDSPGGSVFDGMELVRAIETYGSPVTCVADIKTMSMGFVLLQYCDFRLTTKRTVLMAHGPSSQGEGKEQDLESTAKFLNVIKLTMAEQVCKRSKLTKEQFLEKIDNKDWFFGWEEAKEDGLIDGTVEVEKLPPETVIRVVNPLEELLKQLQR